MTKGTGNIKNRCFSDFGTLILHFYPPLFFALKKNYDTSDYPNGGKRVIGVFFLLIISPPRINYFLVAFMTIGKRTVLGFTILLLLVLITGGTGVITINRSTGGFDEFNTATAQLVLIGNLQKSLLVEDAALRSYLFDKTPEKWENYKKLNEESNAYFTEVESKLSGTAYSDQVASLKKNHTEYDIKAKELGTLIKTEVDLVQNTMIPKGRDAERAIKMLFDKLSLDNNVTGMVNAASATRKYLNGRYFVTQFLTFITEENSKSARQEFTELDQIIKTVDTLLIDPIHVMRLKSFKDNFAAYEGGFHKIEETLFARAKLVSEGINVLGPVMLGKMGNLKDSIAADQFSTGEKLGASNLFASWMLKVVVFAAILIGVFGGWWLIKSITGPLLRSVRGLNTATKEISSAATQIASTSQHLAAGTTEQATSLQESTNNLTAVSAAAGENVKATVQAKGLAAEAKSAAEDGVSSMNNLKTAMAAIKQSSEEILNIVSVIDSIAFQTNLLALNAAVEAARAGDAGKGFAVVAEEVRSLAQRSAQAASETSLKIQACVLNSTQGVAISAQAYKHLELISKKVLEVDSILTLVNESSEKQSQRVNGIAQSVAEIDNVTQTNAASAEQSAAASQELSAQAESLFALARDLGKLVGETASLGESLSNKTYDSNNSDVESDELTELSMIEGQGDRPYIQ